MWSNTSSTRVDRIRAPHPGVDLRVPKGHRTCRGQCGSSSQERANWPFPRKEIVGRHIVGNDNQLSLEDVVKRLTAAKDWNKGSKYGPYDERFFFLQIDQHESPRGSTNTLRQMRVHTNQEGQLDCKLTPKSRAYAWRGTRMRLNRGSSHLSARYWSNAWMITSDRRM